MSRMPDHEIERLKERVSIVRLVEKAGIELRPHGKDRVGRCPFHDDKTPSLIVSPKSNLWHCMGACQAGGSVIDWVMRLEGVSFRKAVEILRAEVGEGPAAVSVLANDLSLAAASAVDAGGTDEAPRVRAAPANEDLKIDFAAKMLAASDDQALLLAVVDYYHATMLAKTAAKQYLDKRGIFSMEMIRHFKLGFANRTLAYLLPDKQVKAGAAVRGSLQRLGVLRESGHEHLNGSLVVPVMAPGDGLGGAGPGVVLELYGRKLLDNLRVGTPKHLYLPECVSAELGRAASTPEIVRYRGVFNEAGIEREEEIILCEALIDALTFWCAGYRNVTTSFGINGFTDELLAALLRFKTKRVLIAYDNDDAGNAAAEKLAAKLLAVGIECYRVRFPKGMDANAYALAVKPAVKALSVVVRQAEWMGRAQRGEAHQVRPTSRSVNEVIPEDVGDVPAQLARLAASDQSAQNGAECVVEPARSEAQVVAESVAAVAPVALVPEAIEVAQQSAHDAGTESQRADREPPARRVAPTPPALAVEVAENGELRMVLGDRRYRVRGVDQNTSDQVLKVWLKVERGDGFHLDTVDLAQDKQRAAWVRRASVEIGVSEEVARSDLGKVLNACETRQSALNRERAEKSKKSADGAVNAAEALSEEQREAGLALLRDPKLIERIVADVEATGVVGEASNALVAYLACVSRKLDKPLAILIQSTSAAGKSTLMDAVLALMPENERVQYSAMTGQSLFYLGEHSMRHKVLAIAEEEGVRQAAYSLKLLQSQGELTIASTGKDPITGQLQTVPYRVQGPVMLFLTSTAIDIDEELLNRCLVLTINESREQTALIQARQRSSRTLQGLLAKTKADSVLAAHRAAQALLKPLAVVNPFAEQLTFASDRVRLRRDHQKYLALIDSIALLHQHQRPVRSVVHGGKVVEYIEVTQGDIALANRLAHEVLGRSLDELPPQTRRLLGQLVDFVAECAAALGIERSAVRFTRRQVREYVGAGNSQLAVHLERLQALEYLVAHNGRGGQRFVYELAFDGDANSAASMLPGLIDPRTTENLPGSTVYLPGSDANLPAQEANSPVSFRGTSGPLPASFRGEEIAVPARPDTDLLSLVAAVAEAARAGRAEVPSHRNGASYAAPNGSAHGVR